MFSNGDFFLVLSSGTGRAGGRDDLWTTVDETKVIAI